MKPGCIIRLETERQAVHVASAPRSAHGVKPAPQREDSASWACRKLCVRSDERGTEQLPPSSLAGAYLEENLLLQSTSNAGQVFIRIYSNGSFHSGGVFFTKVLFVIFALSKNGKAESCHSFFWGLWAVGMALQ